MWVHCAAVYLVTAYVCFLLYNEYKYISSKRIAFFYSSKPQHHQFTLLVRGIPVPPGRSVSDSVDSFFMEYHPSTYLSHVVIHRTSKLRNLITDVKHLYKGSDHLQPNPAKGHGCFGRFPRKADSEMKLGDLEENLPLDLSDVTLAGREVQSAFVSFRSRYGAAVASSMQQSENPTEWVAEQAPEPTDVYWPIFYSSFFQRWMSKVVIILTCILLTVLFLIPVVVAQGLTNLSQLEDWFPFLESILTKTGISQLITGYLPNLILQFSLKMVPPIMKFLSSIQGYISYSEIQRSACYKVLWFIIWNIFFANVLSGSALNQLSVLLDLKNIPARLAVAVPAQASFFIAYVVTSGWTSTSSELFQVIEFIQSSLRKCFCCCCKRPTTDHFEAPTMDYHKDIPKILFFALLGITYFFLAPLILPFLLVYFFLAYIIFKNQFISVYAPKFETGGSYWPIVHNSMIFSLVLMHAIALGIFTLKKVHLASYIMIPLPILTLLFNEYCRKRFLPNFLAYPAETLIKKDREDVNDPQMPEFLNKLVTAYKDPALFPVEFSNSGHHRTSDLSNEGNSNLSNEGYSNLSDDHTTPLLSHD